MSDPYSPIAPNWTVDEPEPDGALPTTVDLNHYRQSAALRAKKSRKRRRLGFRTVHFDLTDSQISRLIAGGLLDKDKREDTDRLSRAIQKWVRQMMSQNMGKTVMATVETLKPRAAATPEVAVTNAQRLKIRERLDKYFDDSRGEYLDKMTDRKIAEDLNIPAIIVYRIREAAYGPIRINPEITVLTKMLETAQGQINEIRNRLDKIYEDVERTA